MTDSYVAIVTGAAQGIGAAIAKALLAKGYAVIVADIQEEKGKEFVKEQEKIHGVGKACFIRCDVTKLEDYKRAFELAIKQFNRIDILVNNAGIFLEKEPLMLMAVNVVGPINGCRTAFEYMGKSNGGRGGSVVNIASLAGFIPHPAFPTYVASKHAVVGLTRSYGHEYHLNKDGVLVMALCPAYVETDILLELGAKAIAQDVSFGNINKYLKPDYVAEGVLKLLEDKVNGSTLIVTKDEGFFYVGLHDKVKDINLD